MTKKKYKWIEKELAIINEKPYKPTKKLEARRKRHVKQYEQQGWCDRDTWCLDQKFAQWIAPRLKRFIEVNNGFPHGMTEKTWNDTLNQMLEGFEFMASDDYYSWDEKHKKYQEKATLAMKLFGEWGQHLWW